MTYKFVSGEFNHRAKWYKVKVLFLLFCSLAACFKKHCFSFQLCSSSALKKAKVKKRKEKYFLFSINHCVEFTLLVYFFVLLLSPSFIAKSLTYCVENCRYSYKLSNGAFMQIQMNIFHQWTNLDINPREHSL